MWLMSLRLEWEGLHYGVTVQTLLWPWMIQWHPHAACVQVAWSVAVRCLICPSPLITHIAATTNFSLGTALTRLSTIDWFPLDAKLVLLTTECCLAMQWIVQCHTKIFSKFHSMGVNFYCCIFYEKWSDVPKINYGDSGCERPVLKSVNLNWSLGETSAQFPLGCKRLSNKCSNLLVIL